MQVAKPYKGRIEQWRIVAVGEFRAVEGRYFDIRDPPPKAYEGCYILTSEIVNIDTVLVETKNSVYRLGEPE